jgi:hypothetical protein
MFDTKNLFVRMFSVYIKLINCLYIFIRVRLDHFTTNVNIMYVKIEGN